MYQIYEQEKIGLSRKETFLLMGILAVAISLFVGKNVADANKFSCKNFQTREQAQRAFDSNPTLYHRLDGKDKDGKACEYLPTTIKIK